MSSYEPDVDPQQDLASGLKSGHLRYTPQQKQQLQRNAATRAWLLGNEVPEPVRVRELSRLDDSDRRIAPMPVPPDEVPPTLEEHLSSNAWVDREGTYSHPGTTWVRNERGGWDIPRSVPNNQLDYVKEVGQPESIAPPSELDIMPQRLPRGGYGQPFGNYHAQESAKAAGQMYSAQAKQQAVLDRQAMGQQALQQRQQQQAARERDAEMRRREREQEQARKQFDNLISRADAIQKASTDLAGKPTKDRATAMQEAEEEQRLFEQKYSPEVRQRQRDYQEYLQDKYAGADPAKFDDEDAKAEIARRGGKQTEAPQGWRRKATIPVAALEELRSASAEDLESFRRHARGRPMTEDEFAQAKPDGNYDRYMAIYRWAKATGKHGPLTVPAAPAATPAKPKRMEPTPPAAPAAQPPEPGGMKDFSMAMASGRPLFGQPTEAEPQPAESAIDRAISAARSGDVGAQQALTKRGIQWQPQ